MQKLHTLFFVLYIFVTFNRLLVFFPLNKMLL